MLQSFIQLMVNLVEGFFMLSFMHLFLRIETKSKGKLIFEIALFGLLNFIIQQVFLNSSLKSFAVMIFCIAIVKLFHFKISIIKIVIKNIFVFMIILAIQMFLSVPYILFFGGNLEIIQNNEVMFFLFMTLTFISEYLIITIIYNRRNAKK